MIKAKVYRFIKNYPKLFNFFKSIKQFVFFKIVFIKKNSYRFLAGNFQEATNIVDKVVLRYPIVSNMVTVSQLRIILEYFNETLEQEIAGDVVEMGCNVGTTSIFIQKILLAKQSAKKFHVYDSFQGLPKKQKEDKAYNKLNNFDQGKCYSTRRHLVQNFKLAGLVVPHIHEGWFGQIPDQEYPKKVSFAFFDGDFFSSILDSFRKIYPRLSKGGLILIHDYKLDELPGVEKACRHFLKNKPEQISLVGKNIGLLRKV